MECLLQPCIDKGGQLITLTAKGIEQIKECSEIRKDGVKDNIMDNAVIQVHGECRRNYTKHPKPPSVSEDEPPVKQVRFAFDFKTLCFLCARKCIDASKCRNPYQQKWSMVETKELIDNIRDFAEKRQCAWGEEVPLRLSGLNDLIHPDGRYHRYCYSRFQVKGSTKPGETTTKGGSTGDTEKLIGFERLCQYVEDNDECQYSLKYLKELFCSLSPDIEPYSDKHLKRKLFQRYGSSMYIAEVSGKNTVICFTGTASRILSDSWYKNRMLDEAEEEKRIIKTAAAIIRRDVKARSYDCSQFPNTDEIHSAAELIPDSLKFLIQEIIHRKKAKSKKETERKAITIGHAIISAVRPRSFVSPVQLGTAVCFHRKFGSRLLIDILANMGVSASYSEVLKYERSATSEEKMSIDGGYVQFVFDNADYNVHTVDGHDTFHAMGGVLCVTPQSAFHIKTNVPRINISARAVQNYGLIELQAYTASTVSGYSSIIALDMQALKKEPLSAATDRILNLFWLSGIWLSGNNAKPGWSGCMEKLYDSKTYERTAVTALPFINLAPSNPSTIYTALLYAAEKGSKNGQLCTMVTFDQPLYAKAREMVASAPSNSPLKGLFIRLGGFHTLLSFLGSIGHIMAGSGLEELWSVVYAKNSVVQMMNGKAYSRAIRALYLTQEALITIFMEMHVTSPNKDKLKSVYASFISGGLSADEIVNSPEVMNFVKGLEEQLQLSKDSGRTQRLWIMFINMVEIVQMFVKAERSGDFYLHLHCIYQMLPIFHASGHFNYAKSAHMYLQDCQTLFSTLCHEEFDKFVTSGYFTIRRSDKFWSGIWSDLTIEQVLMRAMKSNGGLTGGRGITASTIATWVNSMPSCLKIVEAMEEFSGVHDVSSEQHIELREATQQRNAKDLKLFLAWFRDHNPFLKSPELSSLSTGIVADDKVNCDEAFNIGLISLKEIEGKKFSDIHLKRKFAVKSLATVTRAITIRNETVCVNPNQLLHRMVCTVRTEQHLAEIFQYELCTYPPSLFDESGFMRKGSKSSIIKVLLPEAKDPSNIMKQRGDVTYVVDGGHLLHRVVWQRPANFKEICQQYTAYVTNKYGKAIIVFDGYEEENTKDEEHLRRSSSTLQVDVTVEDAIHVTRSQGEFLANVKNKVQFINLLKTHLQQAGCNIIQAKSDADTLIVSTAVTESEKGVGVTVIGDDTDLLVLLIVHAPPNDLLKMVVPKKGQQEEKEYCIQDIQHQIGSMKNVLLAIYAFTGCDTVSSIYRKGKITPFKNVQADKDLKQKLQIFKDPNAPVEAIFDAGKHFFFALFGNKKNDSLDNLRYQLYLQTIAKQPVHSQFQLAVLPPTSAAALEHSFRVYHQVQHWYGVKKDPLEWGWKKVAGHLRPITTAKPAAPEDLLCLISCACSEGCTRHCECVKSGLKCSTMCTNCVGHACSNAGFSEDQEIEVDLDSNDFLIQDEVF